MRTEYIIISGFGGQGIVAAGRTIAYAGMKDKRAVSMLPSYGPEMRGGFANCHVILSDTDIASPIVSMANVVIAMSLPALERFEIQIKPGGLLIVDSYQIKNKNFRKDIDIIEIPATKIAMDLGNIKFANVVMIGAMMDAIKAPSVESMTKAVDELLPENKKSLFEKEMNALYAGMEYVKEIYRFMPVWDICRVKTNGQDPSVILNAKQFWEQPVLALAVFDSKLFI